MNRLCLASSETMHAHAEIFRFGHGVYQIASHGKSNNVRVDLVTRGGKNGFIMMHKTKVDGKLHGGFVAREMEVIDNVNSPVERNFGRHRVRPSVERVPIDTGVDHIEADISHL